MGGTPEGVTKRLKTRQGMGCGVWGVGKIEAMQSAKGGFPHSRFASRQGIWSE
ncbi:hypothetical protein [Moorena sp. SIO4G3]|uniref:hypothetical protein n=1 Tax=Moorena sp. SIO4G3 TaxID=2607821 RepID=UPI001429C4A4|nr:hypothetical protein [Moorena sp. SIO4G3]NEO80156.1 hypothetical protein [Moorena sp. SIO4G3]